MRKIVVMSFITLDGVMQAPGGPEEDTEGGFKHGGWQAPYVSAGFGNAMDKLMEPADLLLGSGKKLFAEGTIPAAFKLTESSVTPAGIIFAHYQRAGEVKTGTVGE